MRRPAGVEKTLAGCLIFVYNRLQKEGRYAQYIFRGYGRGDLSSAHIF